MTAHDDSRPLTPEEMRSLDVGEFFTRTPKQHTREERLVRETLRTLRVTPTTMGVLAAIMDRKITSWQGAVLLSTPPTLASALSDSASPLDAPSGGLCRERYRATRSRVCDDTRVRCKGALGLYAPHPRDRGERQWEPCISQRVWLSYEYPYVRWRCTALRLTGMVSL